MAMFSLPGNREKSTEVRSAARNNGSGCLVVLLELDILLPQDYINTHKIHYADYVKP